MPINRDDTFDVTLNGIHGIPDYLYLLFPWSLVILKYWKSVLC